MLSLDRYATVKHPRLAQLRQRRFLPTFLAFASWITAICVSVPILLDSGINSTLSINTTGLNHTTPIPSKLTSAFYNDFLPLSIFLLYFIFERMYNPNMINPFPFWVFLCSSFIHLQWQTNQMKRIHRIRIHRYVNQIFLVQFKWPTCFSPFTRCWCLFCQELVWF